MIVLNAELSVILPWLRLTRNTSRIDALVWISLVSPTSSTSFPASQIFDLAYIFGSYVGLASSWGLVDVVRLVSPGYSLFGDIFLNEAIWHYFGQREPLRHVWLRWSQLNSLSLCRLSIPRRSKRFGGYTYQHFFNLQADFKYDCFFWHLLPQDVLGIIATILRPHMRLQSIRFA